MTGVHMKFIKLGDRSIGQGHKPFIIAEMSGNHNKSLERALELVDAAAAAGADALKLQTYTPDTMTLPIDSGDFFISDPKSLWSGTSLYKLYGEALTPWEWHGRLFDHAKSKGMLAFSTPFDFTAVDFLESLKVPAYKIASFELVDLELIDRVARTGKPMIMSTGMATVSEIEDAVRTARNAGNDQIVLLKCTSSYPAPPNGTNISTIAHMRSLFGTEVGLSDHTMGVGAAVASVAFGATVIEKHFTLRRADGGVDSAFSLEPEELRSLVVETERAWQAIGEVNYGPTEADRKSLQFRRSLYICTDLKAGDVLTAENLRSIRPGLGLSPKYRKDLLGRRVNRDVKMGTRMSWDLLG